MKKVYLPAFLAIIFLTSFYEGNDLKGIWNYLGGTENGKYDGPPVDYTLQRKYQQANFTAFVIEKGVKPWIYEKGDYTLKGDTCLEMQTWCSQDSKLLGATVRYTYTLRNDSLILNGVLPNGTVVNEYWKRVK